MSLRDFPTPAWIVGHTHPASMIETIDPDHFIVTRAAFDDDGHAWAVGDGTDGGERLPQRMPSSS